MIDLLDWHFRYLSTFIPDFCLQVMVLSTFPPHFKPYCLPTVRLFHGRDLLINSSTDFSIKSALESPPEDDALGSCKSGDVHSLVSNHDDIGYQASDRTTKDDGAAKTLRRMFLAVKPEFELLCDKATSKLDKHRIVKKKT